MAEFEFVDTPLKELLASLARTHNIPIVIDENAINAADIQIEELLISCRASESSLGITLEKILQPHQLYWIARHQVLVVTTLKAAQENYYGTRVYKLIRPVPVERRLRSILWNLAPQSWAVAGGKGEAAAVPPNLIAVYQSPLRHRQLAQMFSQSVIAVLAGDDVDPNMTLNKVEKSLAATAVINFESVPLAEAMRQLSRQCDVNITINEKALGDAGFQSNDLFVTLRIGKVQCLASGLSLLLEMVQPELQWVINGEAITITTTKSADENLSVTTYNTKGLVAVRDVSRLVEAIKYTIAASSWEDVGGNGTIKIGSDGQSLEIFQSEPVHRLLRQLFADLASSGK